MSTSQVVRAHAHRLFGPSQADDVIAALDTADLPLGVMRADRVHLAVPLLSRGDTRRFRDALRLARKDWRDALVAAGLTNDDWHSVLRQQGIEAEL